eukprot:6621639-Pyramimonas_sp.AAC.1
MGPGRHVGNPSGSSATCICRHFWVLKLEYGGHLRREPRLSVNCAEVSGGSPLLMRPTLHVGDSSGSSAT